MSKTKKTCNELDYCNITKLILKGYTNDLIAKELSYSKSTVAYKLAKLFKKFGAKNKNEYIINVLKNIIDKNRKEIIKLQDELFELKFQNSEMKQFLVKFNNVIQNKNLAIFIKKLGL